MNPRKAFTCSGTLQLLVLTVNFIIINLPRYAGCGCSKMRFGSVKNRPIYSILTQQESILTDSIQFDGYYHIRRVVSNS